MMNTSEQLSAMARQAAQRRDWADVNALARQILKREHNNAEGQFLAGLAAKGMGKSSRAVAAFEAALRLDRRRYDAAVELAEQYMKINRYGDADALLQDFVPLLDNSPRYLDMAATIYTNIGLPDKGWPLYRKAIDLQPEVPQVLERYAACSVFVGELDEARSTYAGLLQRYPTHQRNHYQLSRIVTAKDSKHIDQMKSVLAERGLPPEKNIYLCYALGKELEDLGQWDESFDFYKRAGDAVASVSEYDVADDLRLMDKLIEVCNTGWLEESTGTNEGGDGKQPIFVVGLPRSGTTLTERILSSHSTIESIGESYFVRDSIRRLSGAKNRDPINPEMIAAAAKKDIRRFARGYISAVSYRFGDKPLFIEKYPENFLYIGFIAKAFPNAPIVHLTRNPMDSCFALFKQSYFSYAYQLDDLGRYYLAYHRLMSHWREILGERLIDVSYESLVMDQEQQTRRLLHLLGLDFEESCLDFHKNDAPTSTASSVQVREKIHARSVGRWEQYAAHLQPLRDRLEAAGIFVG